MIGPSSRLLLLNKESKNRNVVVSRGCGYGDNFSDHRVIHRAISEIWILVAIKRQYFQMFNLEQKENMF